MLSGKGWKDMSKVAVYVELVKLPIFSTKEQQKIWAFQGDAYPWRNLLDPVPPELVFLVRRKIMEMGWQISRPRAFNINRRSRGRLQRQECMITDITATRLYSSLGNMVRGDSRPGCPEGMIPKS